MAGAKAFLGFVLEGASSRKITQYRFARVQLRLGAPDFPLEPRRGNGSPSFLGQDNSSTPTTNIALVKRKIKFIIGRMENAIANHEFEKARFYSDEERKERENLLVLRERYGLQETTIDIGTAVRFCDRDFAALFEPAGLQWLRELPLDEVGRAGPQASC
jgi:hypothetical protein